MTTTQQSYCDRTREWTFDHLRARDRTAPLCYSRLTTSDVIDQAYINSQSSTVLKVLTVATSAAVFAMGYGGWGL